MAAAHDLTPRCDHQQMSKRPLEDKTTSLRITGLKVKPLVVHGGKEPKWIQQGHKCKGSEHGNDMRHGRGALGNPGQKRSSRKQKAGIPEKL